MTPPTDVLKGTFPRLKYAELASASVARERSPILPARASGEIRKKGTAVVTTFNWPLCANDAVASEVNRVRINAIRKAVDFIVLF